jgi:APA family basic amino acid/polyamine antiporter
MQHCIVSGHIIGSRALNSDLPTSTRAGNAPPPRSFANAGLVPTLGLFTTIMMVVGGVIGSGIFKKSSVMAAYVGSPKILLAIWLVAGLITLFGALTNAEVASIIPETGGQYVFFDRMFGPFFAYLYGWAVFAVIQTGSIAAVAYVFAEYAGKFVALPQFSSSIATISFHVPFIADLTPFADIGTKGLATILVIVLTAVNYIGVKFGGVVQNVFTIAKVAAMAALFCAAFLLPNGGCFCNFSTTSETIHPTGLAMFAAMVAATQGAFWAYDGWNKLTYIAGEVKQPQRNIPLGLIIGMLIVIGIYMFINVAYSYVLPVDEMAKSKLVAADVAERCFAGGGRWIAAAVMLSTFGTTNAIILASARVYFSMARRNVFPQLLGRAHPRFHTPAASLVVQGIWSVALLFSGTFDTLTDMLIFVTWVFYAFGAYGVFVLRRKMPDTPRPYKVPCYPFIPWIFIAFATIYLVFTVYNDVVGYQAAIAAKTPARMDSVFGLLLVFVGAPIYFFFRGRQGGVTQPV